MTEHAPSPLNMLGIKSVGQGGINRLGTANAAAGGVIHLPAIPQRIKESLRESGRRSPRWRREIKEGEKDA